MNLIKIDWLLREKFWNWCENQGCTPEYQGSKYYADNWHVPDQNVYFLALLRWS